MTILKRRMVAKEIPREKPFIEFDMSKSYEYHMGRKWVWPTTVWSWGSKSKICLIKGCFLSKMLRQMRKKTCDLITLEPCIWSWPILLSHLEAHPSTLWRREALAWKVFHFMFSFPCLGIICYFNSLFLFVLKTLWHSELEPLVCSSLCCNAALSF